MIQYRRVKLRTGLFVTASKLFQRGIDRLLGDLAAASAPRMIATPMVLDDGGPRPVERRNVT